MSTYRIDSPLRLTLAYALFGAVWILGSDLVVAKVAGTWNLPWWTSSAKGMVFLVITGGVLFLLSRRLIGGHLAMERALREKEERWQFALRSAGTGTWEWNEVTGEMVFSSQWKAMLGYAEHEIANRKEEWLERIHPDDVGQVVREMSRHRSGETPSYECEYRMRTRDGSYRWMLARGLVVSHLPDGRPSQAFGTHTDITQRKINEARTTEALALVEAVLRASPAGIIAYGPDGRAIRANESAARIVGADVDALLRQNFRELDSWRRSGMLAAAEQALAWGNESAFEGELRTTFGRAFWVDAHFVPFDHAGGRHLLLVVSDETARRRSADELNLMHAALQAAPSTWVITDAHGVIEWVNPAFTRLTGYTLAEVAGQTPRFLRSGRHDAAFYRRLWETISRGEVWEGEICNRRKDGGHYDEHMTVAPVRDAGGVIRHYVAIKEDVTERKQLEQQITRTQRLESIGLLASGIAHDLNNVLTPILLSVELLKAKFPAADACRYLETVETAAHRGAGIVRQVLTFARGIDGGERTEVQPRYLLKDVNQLIEETFPRNIRIELDLPRDVRAVMGDLTQLHQVVLNLAVNARDAMPDGGVLGLTARNVWIAEEDAARPGILPGPHVVVSIADTGTGITADVLEHIFEPFYTTKPRGKGTGLGLSTVYGIVRSHGGVVEVRTELGRGTTFDVLLPAVPTAEVAGDKERARSTVQGRDRRVLVVDDEEPIRRVLMQLLKRRGFTAVPAVDGADALRQFGEAPAGYAAAIVDMMMPGMSGADLTRALRQLDPRLPIIISTGMLTEEADGEMAEDLRTLGIHTFLNKPYAEEDLLGVLAAELGSAPPFATQLTGV